MELFSEETVEQIKIVKENPKTVSNQVYKAIRGNIISLTIKPGTAMSEKDIADILGVSRTPVRETFIRLSREGLVNILPQKGTYVSKISISRAKEERFLRECVELAVLDEFMKNPSEEGMLKLKSLIELQEFAIRNDRIYDFMEYDDEFHKILYKYTNKNLCYQTVYRAGIDYHRLRHLSLKIAGGVAEVNTYQHRALFSLMELNKSVEAKELLVMHLRKLFVELEDMKNNYKEYFNDN